MLCETSAISAVRYSLSMSWPASGDVPSRGLHSVGGEGARLAGPQTTRLEAGSRSAVSLHGPVKRDCIHKSRTRLLASVKAWVLKEGADMARRMRDKDFRDDQWAHRYTGKVELINRFIELRPPRWCTERPG
jgi:hypothetical protein